MARYTPAERQALGILGTPAVKMIGYGCCWMGLWGYIFLLVTLNSANWQFESDGLGELTFFGGASAFLTVGILWLRFIDHQRRRYVERLYREGKLPTPASKG